MAHMLETRNGRAQMAYRGETPWHGLGQRISEEDAYDWQRVCAAAGLDWDVRLADLQTSADKLPVDHKAVQRVCDGRILGVVGPRFVPLQNRDAFLWFQPFLAARTAAMESAGSLKEGTRVWALARLAGTNLEIAQGDSVAKYILLSHGHDGSLAVRIGFTPVRVVCQNTLTMAHGSDASKLIRMKHTKDLRENLDNVRKCMDLANAQFEATAEQYRLLARKSINSSDLAKYVKRVLGAAESDDNSTRMKNMIDEVIRLANIGQGNNLPSVRGTYWTAYNGITEYLGYQRGNNPASRLDSLWFGSAATMNQQALQIALDMAL